MFFKFQQGSSNFCKILQGSRCRAIWRSVPGSYPNRGSQEKPEPGNTFAWITPHVQTKFCKVLQSSREFDTASSEALVFIDVLYIFRPSAHPLFQILYFLKARGSRIYKYTNTNFEHLSQCTYCDSVFNHIPSQGLSYLFRWASISCTHSLTETWDEQFLTFDSSHTAPLCLSDHTGQSGHFT